LYLSAIRHHQTTYVHSAEAPAFDWPVDLWTSPSDRPEPYGACGQVMVNLPVDHNLPTLSGLSPTGSTDSQQQEFHQQEEKIYAQVRISWVRFHEHKWVHFAERPGTEYTALASISVSHLYNLRKSTSYTRHRRHFEKTQPKPSKIGERRKPQPNGKPGYIRIDTVHQGDLDKQKGVYHINAVDEVTQFEVMFTVEKISERYLIAALDQLLETFPFTHIVIDKCCWTQHRAYDTNGLLKR